MIKKVLGALGLFICVVLVLLIFLLPFLAGKHSDRQLSEGAKQLVRQAFADLDGEWVDYHVHLLGLNTQDTFINPKMKSLKNPFQFYRYHIYLRASGIHDNTQANQQYLERLTTLIKGFPKVGKSYLLAFDKYYEKNSLVNLNETEFYVSNDYMYQTVSENKELFEPAVSINPYRKDALEQLSHWHQKGVRLIKWLPNAMGIDPADPALIPFFERVTALNMVILTHTGYEAAVESAEHQAYGNPLKWRPALNLGTKIIFAHVASLGVCEDSESSGNPEVDCFDLAIRLLSESRYKENLRADISATLSVNRKNKVLHTLLSRQDLHARLINGSDYPIPAINVMISTRLLAYRGFLTTDEAAHLTEIYHVNPLLFDFVLKRTVHLPQSIQRWPAHIFQAHPDFIYKAH